MKRFKFGVITSARPANAWEAETVRQVVGTGSAELHLVIRYGGGRQPGAPKTRSAVLPGSSGGWLESGVQELCVREGSIDGLAQLIPGLQPLALDFILDFVGVPTRTLAELEVWRFHHRSPLAFWETLDRDPTVFVELRSYRGARSRPLRSGRFRTMAGSYAHVVHYIRREISRWPADVVKSGMSWAVPNGDTPPFLPDDVRAGSMADRCRLLVRSVRNSASVRLQRYFSHELWSIGIAAADPAGCPALAHVRWLEHPKDVFRADPFGMRNENGFFILCEQFDYRTDRGVIVAIALDRDGHNLREEVVLQDQTHMSYPFLLQYGREIYCIPETHQRKCVTLYRAVRFPWRWERVTNLLEGIPAVDSTVCHWNGRWWLFCGDHDAGPNDKLFVFWSTDLTQGWRSHTMNPVKIDVTSSRPAGTPFVEGGQLFRPAQDCSETYGGRVVINRIVKLSETDFAEEPAWYAEPGAMGPSWRGLHTLSKVNDMYLLDGKRYAFLLSGFQRAARQHSSKWMTRFSAFGGFLQ